MNRDLDNLPNPFAVSPAKPQQPVTQVPQPIDPATAEIIRAIEHEMRHPRLIDKLRPFGSAPHLLTEFRKRIESGE